MNKLKFNSLSHGAGDESFDDYSDPRIEEMHDLPTGGYKIQPKLGMLSEGARVAMENVIHSASFHKSPVVGPYATVVYEELTPAGGDTWAVIPKSPRYSADESYLVGRPAPRKIEGLFLTHSIRPVRKQFEEYRDAWQQKSQFMSSVTDIVLIPEYQKIIGLGRPALPLIIDELRHSVDHWFWALTAIAGADYAEGATTLSEASDRWIEWYDAQND